MASSPGLPVFFEEHTLGFAMAPLKYNSLHSPYFPEPWDDPKHHIDLFFWLGAIEQGNLVLIARYLRHFSLCEKRVLRALADRLDPPNRNTGRYVWKQNRGRPTSRSKPFNDPVQTALDTGDIVFVAHHLRTSSTPDPRVISWLADQMDPEEGRSHFEVKQPRGRRQRGRVPGYPFINDTMQMFLGATIARLYRECGKLESALQEVVGPGKACNSRSAARRAYEYYNKKIAAIKNPSF
jgi:hypothetical protein